MSDRLYGVKHRSLIMRDFRYILQVSPQIQSMYILLRFKVSKMPQVLNIADGIVNWQALYGEKLKMIKIKNPYSL